MYTLKVWFTTLLVSPMLLCLILGIMKADSFADIFEAYSGMIYMFIFGFIFSIPTILVQLLAIAILERTGKNYIRIKKVLSILAILGVCFSFYIAEVAFVQYIGPLIYSVIMVCSIWYFKLDSNSI